MALQSYPLATGYVHINEGMNPYGKLDFAPGFLEQCVIIV